jgi:hypothetical protein
MVFSKENKPKEVTDEIAAMTVYKVVRVKEGDEMYSPYYKEKKKYPPDPDTEYPQLNNYDYEVDKPIADKYNVIIKTTDLPSFVQYDTMNFSHNDPTKIALIDSFDYKRNVPFIDYDDDAKRKLELLNFSAGAYGYLKGFVFSYMDKKMAENAVDFLLNSKNEYNMWSRQTCFTNPALVFANLKQPEEFQYAIIECTIPKTHTLNGKTHQNTYVKTFEGTTSIATKFLKLEKEIYRSQKIKFDGFNVRLFFNINTLISGTKIRITFENLENNSGVKSNYYLEGTYNYDSVTKKATIDSIIYNNIECNEDATTIEGVDCGGGNYSWDLEKIALDDGLNFYGDNIKLWNIIGSICLPYSILKKEYFYIEE